MSLPPFLIKLNSRLAQALVYIGPERAGQGDLNSWPVMIWRMMMKIVFAMMLMMYESKGHRLLEVDFNLSQERSLKCWRGQHILNFERKLKAQRFQHDYQNCWTKSRNMKKIADFLSVLLVPSLLINMSAPHTQLFVFSGWLTSFSLFSCFSVLWQLFCVFCHNWKRLKRFPRVLHTSTADVLSIQRTSGITFDVFSFRFLQ